MSTPRTIQEILAAAGIGFRSSGRWLRLKGHGLDAISLNSLSGAFKDHRTGEHGSFHSLCQKLGIDDGGIVIDAAAITRAKTDQQKAELRTIQYAKTAWARGIPALKPKRPAEGWAQAAWDADQSQYSDYREAVYDYLASRGLDPMLFMPLIRIQMEMNPRYKNGENGNVDAEMVEAGADFAFLIPMYALGKTEEPENISGIQRSFLKFAEDKYSRVRKIGRAMLGKKGVTTLAPTGEPVILPVPGPVIGAGEGFETVASWVQIMRRPAAVCWDWSGLKAWSESLAPHEGAPTISLLVDSDKSETGQRESFAAVRRIVAHPHGKAVYLLPPESIVPDDKGNRDWNDLMRQSPDYFAAEIIHAWHKSDENLALAPVSDEAPVIIREPKDAEVSQIISDAVERNIAFQHAEIATKDYLPKYKEHLEKLIEWKNIPEEERKEKKLKKPKLPPLLIKVTTGVGKSHLILEIIQAFKDVPLLILTRTHDLAEDYAQVGAFHYHGRSMPDVPPLHKNGYTIFDLLEKGARFKSSDCFKYPIVELVAAKNHAPATTACRECAHGKKYILETYHEHSEPFKKATEWFLSNSVSADFVPACPWLYHQSDAARARVVVAPYASYSDTLAQYRTSERTLERLVVVDEIPDLTRQIMATSADFGVYASKCAEEVSYLSCHTQTGKNAEELANLINDNRRALDLFKRVGAWLGSSVGKESIQNIPDEMRRLVNELHIDWLPGATARWEKAELRHGYDPFVPLRTMKGLVESIATRTAIVDAGAIHVHEITTLGDRIAKGLPTILLDATPSPAVEFLVQQKGGQIVHAIAKQHVRIVHINQYLHGRSWKNKGHQKQELSALLDLKEQMQSETGNSPVVLTYQLHCELADKTEDYEWGYFGRDDVGQDNWKRRDMLIFGGPLFSPLDQVLSYNAELMLKRLAGDKSSKDWSAEVERMVEVTVGNKNVSSKAPLPVDPELRQWVLDDYARRMAQGIGRARAVWKPQDRDNITIWIAGGLPLSGLAACGLEVSEYREERQNMNDLKANITQERVQTAVAALQSADKDPTYRQVNAWFERNGMPGVRYDAWKKIKQQQSVYDPDNNTYEVVDELLKALQSVVDSARICGCDPADIARDRIAAGDSLPLVHRVSAALVLEACPRYAGDWPNPENAPS